MLFIDPGAFGNELAIEEMALTPDGYGGQTTIWVQAGTVFARLEPLRAQRTYGQDGMQVTVTHRITIRAPAAVTSGMRMLKGDRVFDIASVYDPDETGRYLYCEAREAGR